MVRHENYELVEHVIKMLCTKNEKKKQNSEIVIEYLSFTH